MADPSDELTELVAKYPRRFGAFLTMVGMIFSYLEIVLPIQEANSGARHVSFSSKGMLLAQILLLSGLPTLILGSNFIKILRKLEAKSTVGFYITVVIIGGICMSTHFLLETWLTSKGYRSR
jgi:hypothetical protein